MAPEPSTSRRTESLDDLLTYDETLDDIFESGKHNNGLAASRPGNEGFEAKKSGLDIDDEVVVIKKRAPVAKLDEERLLSNRGIKALRARTSRISKFRGKGHEFADMQRLLGLYQLWLDDLYPRAKFADGLTIIEQLGHKKNIKIMRESWINEGKPKANTLDDVESLPDADSTPLNDAATDQLPDGNISQTSPATDLRNFSSVQPQRSSDHALQSRNVLEPDDDELDALLAENTEHVDEIDYNTTAAHTVSKIPQATASKDEAFADDIAAMADLEGMW